MNRMTAQQQAQNNTRTWGELLALIDGANLKGMSTTNSSVTRERTAEMLRGRIARENLLETPRAANGTDARVVVILREFG